jgi:RND superfamily putative drug exporter
LLHRALTFLQPILRDWHDGAIDEARGRYVSKIEVPDDAGNPQTIYVTKLDVILKTDPFEPASAETLKLLQAWLRVDLPHYNLLGENIGAECYGITAIGQDLAEVTESDRYRVNGFVLAAILAILLLLVRSVWLAIYLLVTVLASYYAALGATALTGLYFHGHVLTHVDWRVPFFLFIILVAVGEDYNILLISRAMEERRRHGAIEGMRLALAKTGGAITSCGLIMAGTFATLMLAGLNTLTQIGFALAFGVLVDTFVVRPFLVPACAILFWGSPPRPKSADQSAEEEPAPLRRVA